MFVEIEPMPSSSGIHIPESNQHVPEGGLDLPIQGQPTRNLKVGDDFQVPPETPHAGVKNGDKKRGSPSHKPSANAVLALW